MFFIHNMNFHVPVLSAQILLEVVVSIWFLGDDFSNLATKCGLFPLYY